MERRTADPAGSRPDPCLGLLMGSRKPEAQHSTVRQDAFSRQGANLAVSGLNFGVREQAAGSRSLSGDCTRSTSRRRKRRVESQRPLSHFHRSSSATSRSCAQKKAEPSCATNDCKSRWRSASSDPESTPSTTTTLQSTASFHSTGLLRNGSRGVDAFGALANICLTQFKSKHCYTMTR